jgi:hypothetical protein
MTVLSLVLAGVVGAALGAIAACFGTYYGCVLIDIFRGAKGGNGLVTIGWLFLVLTVPVGGIAGAIAFIVLARFLLQ